jgi:hypothetical protein
MGSVTSAHRLRFGRITPSALAMRSRWHALAWLVLAAACGGTAAPTPKDPAAGEWRTFDGTWTASGTRTSLDLGPNHQASVVHLKGSLVLTGDNRLNVGFRAEVVGFSDTSSGMVGRSVWTDERGDKVFSELKGEWLGAGNHIVGTFIGGTGRYAGTTGEYDFQWQYVLKAEDDSVSGRTTGFKGRARVGPAPASTPSGQGPTK